MSAPWLPDLLERIKSAGPFESKRLAEELADEVDRGRRSLTEEERTTCDNAAIGADNRETVNLIRIIERLIGERFLEGEGRE